MGIRGRKISPELEEHLCEMYRSNMSLNLIAAKSHVSVTCLLAVLRRNGVPLRNGKRLSIQQEEDVVKLYNSGESIAGIKENTGVKSEQTIYRILRDAGVKQRRKRRAAE